MKIVLHPGSNTNTVSEYFDFNGLSYEKLDLWNNQLDTFGRNTLDHDLLKQGKTLLITDYATFNDLYSWPVSRQELIDFCYQDNQIWLWNTLDSLVISMSVLYDAFSTINSQIPKGKITLFFDGTPIPQSEIYNWSNINIKILPRNFFMFPPRIDKGTVKKINCDYDFLLTMRRKRNRSQREVLWSKLTANPSLLSQGQAYYRHFDEASGIDDLVGWVGKQFPIEIPAGLLPSMDLYNNSWTELVPETLYDRGFLITEKTIKPIGTKTPFLILSTPEYLDYLHTLGFKTFNTLISEAYDSEYNLELRIDMILEQLQDIVDNGAEDFYRACSSILDHNHNKLAEHSGLGTYNMDLFISENLEQIGIK